MTASPNGSYIANAATHFNSSKHGAVSHYNEPYISTRRGYVPTGSALGVPGAYADHGRAIKRDHVIHDCATERKP